MELIGYNDAEGLKTVFNDGVFGVNTTDDSGSSLLYHACALGSLECLQVILAEIRVEVNLRDKRLDTPQFVALKYSQLECAQALLAHKDCNVNAKNAGKG